MTAATYGAMSDSEHSAQLRKAVIAATIGTTIEWYDFFIYGTAAGLIFGKLYFPERGSADRRRSPPSAPISSASSAARSAPRSSAITATASAARRR